MKKIHLLATIAVGLLAALSAAQQQSYAQYDNGITPEISEDTLKKCADLGIDRSQCTESNVLLRERVDMTEGAGSGTAFIAKEAGQTVALIGVLGAIFGGIAGAFFVMGRGKQVKTA